MKIGDIFNFTNNRIRIIMFDNKEVFYQIAKDDDTLVYANNQTLSYYRTTKKYFENNSKFIEHLAFTEKETDLHKSYLPLRLNCFSGLFWTDKAFGLESEFDEFLKSIAIKSKEFKGIESSEIIIIPTGQQQSNKKSILLKNKNDSFSGKELMRKCFEIQSEYVKSEKPYFSRFRLIPEGREEKRLSGIGIYRLGIKGNVPSYYLGGEMSMMEFESEESLIVKK